MAWEPLGWQAAWFAEIEKFPSAVLAERWPEVTNLGDMTKIAAAVRAGAVEAPEILVGGTPCQAFSIAGLRNGLDDERGQLTLSYVELADAIDDKRRDCGEEEAIIVWENVPGVLSSKDNAFGCFLAGLAGEDSELHPAGDKWSNAGCVYGPSRIVAWRVLDAQFFGVAQRRHRVFVVASARSGFDPAKVLFEFEGVRRDTPPRRESQQEVAFHAGERSNGSHWDNLLNPHPTLSQALKSSGGIGGSNQEIFSQRGAGLVAMAHGQAGAEINTEGASPTITCNHEATIIAYSVALRGREGGATAELGDDAAGTLRASSGGGDKQHILIDDKVRRLTPREYERLQGFPDDHTLIAWRGKDAANCPDGPRYKAIGNSMAVPVMRWIGERIATALPVAEPAPRIYQRPFLKWAGGKYSLLPELDRLIPAGKRLIEPFVGGGSVFLNSDKHDAFLLADVNSDLINLYQMLAVVPELVTELAQRMFSGMNSEEDYCSVRLEFNTQLLTGPQRAAAFLYLNRHCFNGLIRYNRDGQFNVGFGKYRAPYFPAEEIKAFASMAHNCVFMNAGYRRSLALAGEGDVVYCDPPYEPLPGTAGFTNYAAGGFTWDDQIALAECCVAAHQRGARVVITNSSAPRVIDLYEQHGFTLHHVSARRAISSKGSTRETAADIVAIL